MSTEIRFRVALDGAQQVQAGAQAAAQGMDRLAQASGAAQRQAGLTGQQTAQLSNQLQDLFIQIQAGGNPLTAFLQQGSQLSAVFGGAGNALRAVAGLVTPTVAAFAGVAAAVGTVAYAFLQGDKERMAFARGIVLTGNAAGVTASQLNEMAKAAASFGATRGQGADVLAQLVATGQVAAGVLGQATEAAIRLQRDGGIAIDQTVKAFADLGKNPVEAIKRLNDGQNFLSAGTYKQIRALQDQGKEFEAARVAQEAYATASISRTKELEAQLGLVEKAWRLVGREAAAAWQAILNIGAPATTLDRFNEKQAEIAKILASAGGKEPAQGTASALRIGGLRTQLEFLRAQVLAEQEVAQATADGAEARDKSIKSIDKQADAAKKAADEFKQLALAGRDLVQSFTLEEAGSTTDIIAKWEQLNAARKAGLITLEQQIAAQQRLAQLQPFAQRELKDAQDLARARADARNAEDKGIQEYIDQQQKAREASLKGVEDSIAKLQEENAAAELMRGTNLTLAEAIEQVAIARLREQQARYSEGSEPYLAVEREIEARQRLQGLLAERSVRDASTKAAKDAADEWQRTTDDIRSSLTNAFRESFRDGEDFGQAFARNIGAELKARLATAVAEGLAGLALQTLGLTINGAAGANGAAGQTNSYLQAVQAADSLFGYGKSAYGYAAGLAGYGTATGTGLASATASTGTGLYTAAGVGGTGSGLSATAGGTGYGLTAGSEASGIALSTWAAAIAAGIYKANQDYSAGFRRDQAKDFSNSLGAGGYAFGGFESDMANALSKLGFSDRLADLLTGSTAVAALLGYSSPQIRNAGVTGSITGGDFTGNATAQAVQQAGFVRKLFGGGEKVTDLTTALPEEIGRFLDAGAAGILDKAKSYGAALGLPADALTTVSAAISIKADEAGKLTQDALVGALSGYGDALVAGFADAVKPLAAYGETTVQTIERVGASILGVNEVLDALGLSALKASIEGGKAATELEALFGGLNTLQQAAGSYVQNYYSDAERAALATKGIGQALAGVGLALPTTRDQFRALVDAQDLTTNSGRQAFAALMGVADAFAAITPEATVATAKLKTVADLQAAIDANIGKFLTPQQATDYQYGTIARDLQTAGLFGDDANLAGTLKGASKDQIFAFASQFVDLASNSTDAKVAIVEAAGALADLKEVAGDTSDEFARRIAQFTGSLRSSDLSPLSYREQLSNARGLYESTLGRVQAGDTSAQQDLLGNAQAYLQEARTFFGSGAEYAAAFQRVTTQLDALGAPSVDPQVQAIREQVLQLEAVRSSVVDLSTTSGNRADTQAELARAQIIELQNVVQAQDGTNQALAAGHRALWDQLEALNVRVQRLLDNAQLDAVSPT